MLSLFGYPDAKLAGWKRSPTGGDSEVQERLDAFFVSVCEIIYLGSLVGTHSLSRCHHALYGEVKHSLGLIRVDCEPQAYLHFAFGGRVPAINYPLQVLVLLSLRTAE
jgi:hypothetical protein